MTWQRRGALGVLLAVGMALAMAAPAAAATTGPETFKGVIVTSGVSGERIVVNSVVVAKGVFRGVGAIVEIPNLPSDPDNVSREDLVFAEGTIHIVSTTVDFSFSVNPHSCLARATLQQTGEILGGTGLFAAATGSFTGTVTGSALLPRNPDGSCSFEQAALHEVDRIAGERDAVVLTVRPPPGDVLTAARTGGDSVSASHNRSLGKDGIVLTVGC